MRENAASEAMLGSHVLVFPGLRRAVEAARRLDKLAAVHRIGEFAILDAPCLGFRSSYVASIRRCYLNKRVRSLLLDFLCYKLINF